MSFGRNTEKKHNHFPKTHRSVLRKIKIDLLHFEVFMTSIYEKKVSAEVQLILAEQMPVYNFIISKAQRQIWDILQGVSSLRV